MTASTKPRPEQIAATVRELDRLDVDPGSTITESSAALRQAGVGVGTERLRLAVRARRDRAGLLRPTPKAQRGTQQARPAASGVQLDSLVDQRLSGALCAGRFPMFDAEVAGETFAERTERLRGASRLCDRCPVHAACELAAIELGTEARGVWAGSSR